MSLRGLSREESHAPIIIRKRAENCLCGFFIEYLVTMFEQYPECIREDVPRKFALNHLVGSLAEAVKWWIGNRMEMSPEKLAEYYLKLTGYHTG